MSNRQIYGIMAETVRCKGGNAMSSEKEIKLIQIATIYELRMILTNGEKEQYTL